MALTRIDYPGVCQKELRKTTKNRRQAGVLAPKIRVKSVTATPACSVTPYIQVREYQVFAGTCSLVSASGDVGAQPAPKRRHIGETRRVFSVVTTDCMCVSGRTRPLQLAERSQLHRSRATAAVEIAMGWAYS